MKWEDNLKAIFGLGVFVAVVSGVASLLPPTAAAGVMVIAGIVVLCGLGSIILSVFLGGDGFDHLLAGFVLALAGFCVVHFIFGWQLLNPFTELMAKMKEIPQNAQNGIDVLFIVFLVMIEDLCIVAVGMAIVAVPMLPVIWKLQKSWLAKAATPVSPNQSSTLGKLPDKGDA